jgi:hypothetical protein
MKLLKSTCEKIWLFDCRIKEDYIEAGLACFLPHSPSRGTFVVKDKTYVAQLSSKAVDKPGAIRISNARLPLFDSEQ